MKFRAASTLLCLSLSALYGQSELRSPRAAVIRYQSGALHSLFGLGSNYVVNRPSAGLAVASAFSDSFGLISDGLSLTLLDEKLSTVARVSCAEAKPVLSIGESPESAVAWLPSQSSLIVFDGRKFVTVPVSGMVSSSAVTAVSKLDRSTLRLLQTQPDGSVFDNLISTESGQVTTSRFVADAHGTAALLLGSIVSVFNGKLHAISFEGNSVPFEFPFETSLVTFEQCSTRGLHIASPVDTRHWILYREKNQFVLAELPGVPQ